MSYFSVKDWKKHQHYKDRNPPWIKLHKDLLHDYEFTCLQDASKLQLMLIWLLASQMDNRIPIDQKWLQNALHLNSKIDLKTLKEQGFIEFDSDALAGCKQSAKRIIDKFDFSKWPKPPDEQIFIDWLAMRKIKKAPVTKTVINTIGNEITKAVAKGFTVDNCLAEAVTRSWQGFKADWMDNNFQPGKITNISQSPQKNLEI